MKDISENNWSIHLQVDRIPTFRMFKSFCQTQVRVEKGLFSGVRPAKGGTHSFKGY